MEYVLMGVRRANKFDFPAVLDLLHKFKTEGHTNFSNSFNNEEHVATVFAHILAGRGVALVAEKDNKIIGMFLAIIDSIIWDPETLIMRELAYYVDKEHRGGTNGYRLIKEYVNIADEMVADNRILAYSIVKMENSPNLKFEKFGFKKTEEVYVAGLV
jgi:GNAT superfamily N-acetyltransferase